MSFRELCMPEAHFARTTLLGDSVNRGNPPPDSFVCSLVSWSKPGKEGEGNETNTIDTHGGGPYGIGSGIRFVRGSFRPRRTSSSIGGRRHGRREVCGPGGGI